MFRIQQNLGRGLWPRQTGLSFPSPRQSFITARSKAVVLLKFILIVTDRFLLVFDDLLILFRKAWWTYAGKELTSRLSACAVFLRYVVLIFYVPFPYGVWGRKWNSIVTVPDHCNLNLLWLPRKPRLLHTKLSSAPN